MNEVDANLTIFVRWALSEPLGRQTLFFQKTSGRHVEDDEAREKLTAVWYNMFLERRDDYLTERIWKYMQSSKNNMCKVEITFNNDKPDANLKDGKIILPLSFLQNLDKDKKLRKEISKNINKELEHLKKTGDKIDEAHLVAIARKLRSTKNITKWQQNGIVAALNKWNKGNELKTSLDEKIFRELYQKELQKEKEITEEDATPPIYPFELSSRFLFMWQNIAIYYPEVRKIYIFAYSKGINQPPCNLKSSLSFFSKKLSFQLDNSFSDSVFKTLELLEKAAEKAAERSERESKPNDHLCPKWKMALSSLEKYEQKTKGKGQCQ
ncbi:MAG: hypothetical protein HWN69_02775 [Desulfobacterales bacterium]|nr:hypothetical protein [Desulfobacterales bacterium]